MKGKGNVQKAKGKAKAKESRVCSVGIVKMDVERVNVGKKDAEMEEY